MAAKRPPLPKFNTPEGTARYPHLNRPDTKFDDDGEYKCDLIVDRDEEAEELIAYLEGIRDEKFKAVKKEEKKKGKKGKAVEIAEVFALDSDDAGDETGKVIFKTKMKAVGSNKKTGESWTNEPKLFDSTGEPLPKSVQIWSGSRLIVAGTVNVYAMTNEVREDGKKVKIISVGVSLKCRGVQVIDLVSSAGQTAESYGFGTKSGGYRTEAAQAGLGNTPDDSTEEGGDEDGDEDEF